MEGIDQRALTKIWQEVAESEERLVLMREMIRFGIGFNEIEHFDTGQRDKLRSTKMKMKVQSSNLVKDLMTMKMRDEECFRREKEKTKCNSRKKLQEKLGKDNKQYKTLIRNLRTGASKAKEKMRRKNLKKLAHLRKRFGKEKVDKGVPKG